MFCIISGFATPFATVLDTKNPAISQEILSKSPAHSQPRASGVGRSGKSVVRPLLFDELANTLNYPKFAQRIAQHCATTPSALTVRYGALVMLVTPADVPRVVIEDADDDQELACAAAAQANLIVSGDKHLLHLGGAYQRILIVTPAETVRIVAAG